MRHCKWIVFVLVLFSCQNKGQEHLHKKDFSITADSGLYFKNVRQLYYDFQEIPLSSNRYVYRLKNRAKHDDHPILYPAIVIDWIRDEASILIEPNNYPGIPYELKVKIECEESAEVFIVLDERGKENMLDFAIKLYDAIVDGCTLSLQIEKEFIPLMQDGKSQEAYRRAMSDYYKLVRIL